MKKCDFDLKIIEDALRKNGVDFTYRDPDDHAGGGIWVIDENGNKLQLDRTFNLFPSFLGEEKGE